jgi:hypothetical protein
MKFREWPRPHTLRWRLDAGPMGADHLALAGGGCLCARPMKIWEAGRWSASGAAFVVLLKTHLAGGTASAFPLKGKISDDKGQKIIFQMADSPHSQCAVRVARYPTFIAWLRPHPWGSGG